MKVFLLERDLKKIEVKPSKKLAKFQNPPLEEKFDHEKD
jgi:hypothetical protein